MTGAGNIKKEARNERVAASGCDNRRRYINSIPNASDSMDLDEMDRLF